jgi:hypothetical protein
MRLGGGLDVIGVLRMKERLAGEIGEVGLLLDAFVSAGVGGW